MAPAGMPGRRPTTKAPGPPAPPDRPVRFDDWYGSLLGPKGGVPGCLLALAALAVLVAGAVGIGLVFSRTKLPRSGLVFLVPALAIVGATIGVHRGLAWLAHAALRPREPVPPPDPSRERDRGPSRRPVDRAKWTPCPGCGTPGPSESCWDPARRRDHEPVRACGACGRAEVPFVHPGDAELAACLACRAPLAGAAGCPGCSLPRGWTRRECPGCANLVPARAPHGATGCPAGVLECGRCDGAWTFPCRCPGDGESVDGTRS